MKKIKYLIAGFVAAAMTACTANYKNLDTVPEVDVEKYMGTWYEIARLPNSFEEGLECITATYKLKEDGEIDVINRGREVDDDYELKEANGTAWLPDTNVTSKLKVSFFWPFSGNYWILELDKDYKHVLIGEPSREYMWILSRTPQMDEKTYNDLVQIAKQKGFATENLIKVNHDCEKK
jgi:apolipoprotein D and lipocalin family protein